MKVKLLSLMIAILVSVNAASAQTTVFTYQGKLTDGANPANGSYDMQFKLFDTATVGTGHQIGAAITNSSVPVSAGSFTVQLDFGAGAFGGPPRFLEIAVRQTGSPDPYTLLSPRQAVTSTPYSVRSMNSSVADTLSSACVGCVTSTQVGSVAGSAVTGTVPVASLPAGSGNYVQNTTSPQTSSNFNIDGNGTAGGTLSANAITSATQYNIGVNRVLALAQVAGVFVGRLAGVSNTTGSGNSFFGESAGRFNINASNNSFFGREAGTLNTASDNSFFGAFSGNSNTTGTRNSFFGRTSGDANQTGSDNSFFGYSAGRLSTANFNSFFGSNAGDSTTSGANNAFFGYNAGTGNSAGAGNSFFGSGAGQANTADGNSFFGFQAGFSNTSGTNNAFFGTGAGGSNIVGSRNSFFGYQAGDSNTSGGSNSFFGFNAGAASTTSSGNSFFGFNAGALSNSLSNSFFGSGAGAVNTSGQANTIIGSTSGSANTTGDFNVFVGTNAGNANTTGSNNTIIGAFADVGLNNLSYATAIGSGATVFTSNTVVLGASADKVSIPGRLDVSSTATFGLTTTFDSLVKLNTLGGNGTTDLCLNSSKNIADCSSSLRYKTNVQTFTGGLNVVRRLRPITFHWIDGGHRDIGFGAEDVNEIEPLLTTRNAKDEIEGVKYRQITTVLVNAVKEQQEQIENQQRQIGEREHQAAFQQTLIQRYQKQLATQQTRLTDQDAKLARQQRGLDTLKQLVCQAHPKAKVCQGTRRKP